MVFAGDHSLRVLSSVKAALRDANLPWEDWDCKCIITILRGSLELSLSRLWPSLLSCVSRLDLMVEKAKCLIDNFPLSLHRMTSIDIPTKMPSRAPPSPTDIEKYSPDDKASQCMIEYVIDPVAERQ